MTVVYDAGALIAADRIRRRMWVEHRARLEAGLVPVTAAPVVSPSFSSAPQQVQPRRFLAGCEIVPFERADAHRVGALLARAARSDVVDAHVVMTASRLGRAVLTTDPGDLRALSEQLLTPVEIRSV